MARQIGVSAAFVSAVARGVALPGPQIAAFFGFVDDGNRWVRRGKGNGGSGR